MADDILKELFESYTGQKLAEITELPASGSNRRYFRLKGGKVAVVPMRKNMKRQIQSLEAEGFDQFEKIYAR